MAVKLSSNDPMHTLLSNTVFFVEGDGFIRHNLEKENRKYFDVLWEQEDGYLRYVGKFGSDGEYEVYCAFTFYLIGGKRVCFYYPTSQYVSWPLIEEFLEPYWKLLPGGRKARCDAQNFSHCILYLKM